MKTSAVLFVIVVGSITLSSCSLVGVATGPTQTYDVHVGDTAQAEKASVDLNIGAGQIVVNGGANKMVDGVITYNVAEWRPIVKNSTDGHALTVNIKQPDNVTGGSGVKYDWDLKLNDHVPTDLSINCGAGEARLNLGTLSLTGLTVNMGAGKLKLDLSGQPSNDYSANVRGGVGEAEVRLPSGVGVWLDAHGGIGGVDVTGLTKHGDHWENDLYGKSKVTVKVSVAAGIGKITIAD